MAFRFDREKLKTSSRAMLAVGFLSFLLVWVVNSVSVAPDFLKSGHQSEKKEKVNARRRIAVDEVLKLPPKAPEKAVIRVPRVQLDRSIRPHISSSLRGFGESGADIGGDFSETGGGATGRVEDAALERQARLSRRVEPDFPQTARERGLSGVVALEIEVLSNGQVGKVRILESSPPGYFESAAIEAAKKWTFDPAMVSGTPVASVVIQKMRFDLE